MEMKKKVLIEGMSCQNCVRHVTEALSELEGISSVEVKLEEKLALIELLDTVKDEEIIAAVEEVGYEVLGIEAV